MLAEGGSKVFRLVLVVTYVHISPEDKLRFMQDLAANSGDPEVMDNRVVRRH